ncbi:MAG: hypothetical protein U0165_06185 [Polyangiaceae bacterium]
MLTDKAPVDANDYPTLLKQVLDPAVRPTPRTLGAYVGDRVERAIAQALSIDPSLRPTDIGEFWGMLKHAIIQDEVGRSLPAPMPSAMVSFAPPPVGFVDVPSAPIGAPWSSEITGASAGQSSSSSASSIDPALSVTSAIGDLGDHDEPPPGTLRIPVHAPGPHRISVPPPTSPSNAPPQVTSSSSPSLDLGDSSRKTKKGTFIMLDSSEAQARIDSLIQRDISTGSSRPSPQGPDPRLPFIPPPPPVPTLDGGAAPHGNTQRSRVAGPDSLDSSYAPPAVVQNPRNSLPPLTPSISDTPLPAMRDDADIAGVSSRPLPPFWILGVGAIFVLGLLALLLAKVFI